ncbi:MAG: GntR family transcriptional regulator [Anaerolineaceae bacterium]|nr:GntR family transcriptional regulator [Anaerolineaceae bacterium]
MAQINKLQQTNSAQARRDEIINEIRHLILSGYYSPGDHLVQDELADKFGTSRTPIREALSCLAQEGLVNLSSYKGASVAKISIDNLKEIYTVRMALESHATYLAAKNANEDFINRLFLQLQEMGDAFKKKDFEQLVITHNEFHLAIYRNANRSLIYELILRYMGLCNPFQRISLYKGRAISDPIIDHHDIIQILSFREAESAAILMRNHLRLTMIEVQSFLKEEQNKSLR